MSNTYTWNILDIESVLSEDGTTKIAKGVEFFYRAVSDQLKDDGNPYTAEFAGVYYLKDPDQENFTDFDNLTKEQVLGWILENLEQTEEQLQNALSLQIEDDMTPDPIIHGLPSSWS